MKSYEVDTFIPILQMKQRAADPDGEGACWPLSPHSPQACAWVTHTLVGRQVGKRESTAQLGESHGRGAL